MWLPPITHHRDRAMYDEVGCNQNFSVKPALTRWHMSLSVAASALNSDDLVGMPCARLAAGAN